MENLKERQSQNGEGYYTDVPAADAGKSKTILSTADFEQKFKLMGQAQMEASKEKPASTGTDMKRITAKIRKTAIIVKATGKSSFLIVRKDSVVKIIIPVAGWKEADPGVTMFRVEQKDDGSQITEEVAGLAYEPGRVLKQKDGVLELHVPMAPDGTVMHAEKIQKYIYDNLDTLTVDGLGEDFTEQGVKDLIDFLQNEGITVSDSDLTKVSKNYVVPENLIGLRIGNLYIAYNKEDCCTAVYLPPGSEFKGQTVGDDGAYVLVPYEPC